MISFPTRLARRPTLWFFFIAMGWSRDAAAQARPTSNDQVEITGAVTDSMSGDPLPNVEVSLAGSAFRTMTNKTGRYLLTGRFGFPASVTFRSLGYAAVTRTIATAAPVTRVNVALSTLAVEIPAVTATVDREEGKFLKAQQATSRMTSEQVSEKRGQNVGETIKQLPGVSIIQYGPSIAKPMVRGLHSQRIATVSSGVPMEGQQWGGEHAPEIDAFAASEIDVIRGPATLLYGSGALGGVVNVKPRPLPRDSGFAGEVSLNGFANNRQGAMSVMLEGGALSLPVIGSLGWRVQGSMRHAGDAKTPGYYLPNTGYRELDFSMALGKTGDWGRSDLTYSHYGTHLGLYLGAHVGNLEDLQRALTNPLVANAFSDSLGHPDQRVDHELIAWRSTFKMRRDASLDVSYGYQFNNRREYDNHGFAAENPRPAFALELYTHSIDIRYHASPLGQWATTVGVTALRQGNLSPGRSFLIPQYRLYTGGLYGLEEYTVGRWTITGGGRLDLRWQHAYQYGAPVVVSPDDRTTSAGLSGSFGTSYKLTDTWSLGSTMSHAWRPPNVNERFSQGVHHGTAQYEIGDSSIGAERSTNIDGTIRHISERTRVELSAYFNDMRGYIFLRPRDPVITVRGAFPAYTYAQSDAVLRGLEATAEMKPSSWLTLYANANLVRGEDRATNAALYDMPADRITSSVRFAREGGETFAHPYFELGMTHVRQQTHTPSVTIYKLPTAGYTLVNLEVGAARMRVGRIRVQPSLSVRNAGNTRYRDYLSRYRLFVDDIGRDIVLRFVVPLMTAK